MTMALVGKLLDRCQRKTAAGNCYPTRAGAEAAAVRMRRLGKVVVRFKCVICDGWHVGRWRA
jgi:hypothetical protein